MNHHRPPRTSGVLALLAVFVGAVFAAGCGDDDDGSSGGTANGSEPIEVGAVLAQAGLFSPYDIANTIGVQLAAEDIDREADVDGRESDVPGGDYKSNPELGGAVARELIGDGAQ